jgi:hypothetical protein
MKHNDQRMVLLTSEEKEKMGRKKPTIKDFFFFF